MPFSAPQWHAPGRSADSPSGAAAGPTSRVGRGRRTAGDQAMPNRYFLKIDGIEGESQKEGHKGEIEVLSWSWGATNSGTVRPGGTSGERDIVITKAVDKSSASLTYYLQTGRRAGRAVLVGRADGPPPVEFLTITMEDVWVAGLQTGGSANGLRLEQIILRFTRFKTAYYVPRQNGGAKGGGWGFSSGNGL
jgi:type VI secretion system secreted protein Hcp